MRTVQTNLLNHQPMKPVLVITLAVLGSLLSACSSSSYLGRAEQSCNKYPTPDERAACERKNKEGHAAFEKHQEQEQASKKQAEAPDDAKVPKNTLCFKRQSTGETVCPN